MKPVQVFVGLDPTAEPVAYHVFCQSVIEHSSVPVSFTPLCLSHFSEYTETHTDGSNQFIYSRFLVPYLCDYQGFALFFDGDMLCRSDIKELIELADPKLAVQVVKHDYTTKFPVKYLGAKNENYPRKNWSSVVLWNCGHHQNKKLTPAYVMSATGSMLHKFEHLEDRFIGELPPEWNFLDQEEPYNPDAKLVHYTIGTPCFNQDEHNDYNATLFAGEWWEAYRKTIYPLTGIGFESAL